MPKRVQNPARLEELVLQALESLIAQDGLPGVTMVRIAQVSGINKHVLYRHFGGIKELLQRFIQSEALFPHFSSYSELFRTKQLDDPARVHSRQMIQLFRQLRASKAARQLLKASLTTHSGLAQLMHHQQEGQLLTLLDQFALAEEVDPPAASALLLGGLYYLTLMAHHDQPVLGLNLRQESDWLRIEASLQQFYRRLSAPPTPATRAHSPFTRVA